MTLTDMIRDCGMYIYSESELTKTAGGG